MPQYKAAFDALRVLDFQITHAQSSILTAGFSSKHESEKAILDHLSWLHEEMAYLQGQVLFLAHDAGQAEIVSTP